jgi:RNA polymerase sigma-70 factor (ECF subfamily)
MELDDKELVTKAKSGDRKAFDELVRLNKDKMFALIYRMTGDREITLDLLQDTFFAAYKELGGFRGDSRFYSWLYRIASSKTLNYLKRKKILSFFSLSAGTPDEPSYNMPDNVGFSEINDRLIKAVDLLPPKQKLIFNLRFFDRLSFPDIAGILNKGESTVKTNYQKAIEKLQNQLKDFR